MSESNRQYLITLDNLAAFKEDISESIDALDAVKILNLQDVEGVSNSLAQIDNAVYSESSIALGKKNKVGSWGYKIQEFTFNENGEIIIKTNTNHGLTEAIKGKAISIIYRKEFVFTNCGTISSFTNDTIVIAPNAAVEYPTEPPSDGIDAYLKFVEYPNLGTIRLDTEGAMAIGYETLATDYGAVSGGNKSTADGAGSISVGINNFTGYGASSFGGQNKSMARYSSTENFNNAVYAEKAHAEGSNNIIGKTAISAHVEGHQNKVRKDISSYHLNNAGEILPTANHVEEIGRAHV